MINFYIMEKFWLEYKLKDLQQTLKALEMRVDFVRTDNGKFIDEERNASHEDKVCTQINTILVSGNLLTGVEINVSDKIMLELYKLNKDNLENSIRVLEDKIKNLEK